MLRSTTAAKRTCWSPSITTTTTLYLPTFVRRCSVEQAKEFHGEAAARRNIRPRPAFLQFYGSSRDDSRSSRCFYCSDRTTDNHHTRDASSSSSQQKRNNDDESAPEASIDDSSGEDAYQNYLRAQTRYETLKQEKEREKSRQMFEAWERAAKKQEQFDEDVKKKGKDVSGGVAVVRTLAKQTRKDQEEEQHHGEVYWEQQARKYLEVAAVRFDHPHAKVQLANQLLGDVSSRLMKDDEEQRQQLGEQLDRALNLYRCSGTAEGWFNAGHLLWTGFPDQSAAGAREDDCSPASAAKEEEGVGATILLSPNFEAAMEAFDEAIALGDADAMYFVGVQQLSVVENNVGQDGVAASETEHLQRGLELVNKSALLGHGGALYYKALLRYNGHDALGIPPCSPGAFTEYLDAAADAGNYSDAIFLRGHSLYHGDMGYPQDYRRAHSDFVEAAGAGHADAAVSAGAMFYKGYPPHVPRDRARAFALYQQAGEWGSVEGWRNVVSCYALGHGVPQSKAIAKYIAETMLKDED